MAQELFRPPGDTLFIRGLAQSLENELAKRGMSIALAEGCFGGSLADVLTIPGATRVIGIGGVFHTCASKIALGVSPEIIKKYGEYSLETAMAMAQAARNLQDDDIAITSAGDLATPSDIYLGFSMKNKPSWGVKVHIPSTDIRTVKLAVNSKAISLAHMYLQGRHNEYYPGGALIKSSPDYQSSRMYVDMHAYAKLFIEKAQEKSMRILTMESCTAGAIANALTDIPEAYSIYDQGWLTYNENAKIKLGVSLDDLAYGNVYSQHVAIAMAAALSRKEALPHIAIATTGLMDTIDRRPYHNHTKPGTIHTAVIINGETFVHTFDIPTSSREQMKLEATSAVLSYAIDCLDTYEKSSLANSSTIFVSTYE